MTGPSRSPRDRSGGRAGATCRRCTTPTSGPHRLDVAWQSTASDAAGQSRQGMRELGFGGQTFVMEPLRGRQERADARAGAELGAQAWT
jgi:hypothetical protein